MLDKMIRMRNRKAFTLIEMLVVIAIIAILIAIVVPMIAKHTTKSRAATNAANLRSIEGQLSTLRVSHPDCFDADNYLLGYITADDGTFTLRSDSVGEVTVEGAPTSVEVVADTGMDVSEGQEMMIYFIDGRVAAAYKGSNGKGFTKDDFAEVAETGKYTGQGGMGTAESDVAGWFCDKDGHYYESQNNGTHKCRYCGATEDCYDTIPDGRCDWPTCLYSCMHDYKDNGACKYCGEGEHTCEDNGSNKIAGYVVGSPDGECDDCGLHVHKWVDGGCKFDQNCGACPTCEGSGTEAGCGLCGKKTTHTCNAYSRTSLTDSTCTCGHAQADHAKTSTICSDYKATAWYNPVCINCKQNGHLVNSAYEYNVSYGACSHNTD